MPIEGFNIGKEVSLDLVHAELGVISFGLVTSFQSKPRQQQLTSTPITNSGVPVHRTTFGGWEGSFEIDRANGVLDTLFQYLEDRYFAGNGESYFVLTETITNPDTSIEEYRYVGVVITYDDHGTWRAEDKVTQRFSFLASKRERV